LTEGLKEDTMFGSKLEVVRMGHTKLGMCLFFLIGAILIRYVGSAEGAELVYEHIVHAPPAGYVLLRSQCMAGFGERWINPSEGKESEQLGYYQGQLIGQLFLLKAADMKAGKNFSDLKIVKGATVDFVNFAYYGEMDGAQGAAYMMTLYFVDAETRLKVCPGRVP
jgi:hypothetical protein